MRKFACACVVNGAKKQWHTFGPRVRGCGHEGRPFAPGLKALVETRLAMPNTRGKSRGGRSCLRPKCKDRCKECRGMHALMIF